ncbi:MAG: hypothetical protein ABJQ90_10710 [Parasphingorhabdus sp.]
MKFGINLLAGCSFVVAVVVVVVVVVVIVVVVVDVVSVVAVVSCQAFNIRVRIETIVYLHLPVISSMYIRAE